MNKRAQFFIIAALILAGIILILGKTYTASKTDQANLKVYDLSSQLQYEASQVIDNGIYNDKSLNETKEELKNLSELYSKLNPDSDIYIMFGNASDLYLIEYNSTSRRVNERALQNTLSNPSGDVTFETPNNQRARVRLRTRGAGASQREVSHELDVSSRQSFYIIIRKSLKDQNVIVYR